MMVSLVALFVALGGAGYAATGGTFILGATNSADKTSILSSGVTTGATFRALNSGGKPAASFVANVGVPPFAVGSSTKVTNLNADKLDGLSAGAFPQYKRTILVSPVGTPSENGAALVNKLAAITGASAGKPYLLKVEPGVYQVSLSLQMQPYVDIEGSGQGVTTIEGAYGSSNQGGSSVVRLSANAELRDLTVENVGDATNQQFYVAVYLDSAGAARDITAAAATNSGFEAYGIWANSNSTASFYHVDAAAQGGSSRNAGVSGFSAHLTIIGSMLSGSGGSTAYGLFNQTQLGTFEITRSTLSASDGSTNEALASGSAATVRGSVLTSTGATAHNNLNIQTIDVAESQLVGGTVSGTVVCAGVYDENFAFSASTSP